MFTPMTEVLQPGKLGEAEIKHFTVTKDASMWSSFRPGEYCPEGEYAQLFVNGRLVMSDTHMEKNSNYDVVSQATGHTAIAGLGLGMILIPILRKPEVTEVTVIEKSQDVIDLVLPQLKAYLDGEAHSKLTVICADVLEWKPPKGWNADVIYFDIWPDICEDNLKDMNHLHRRFARRHSGWMGSWMEHSLKARRRRSRRERW
jgi:hypothetical protein